VVGEQVLEILLDLRVSLEVLECDCLKFRVVVTQFEQHQFLRLPDADGNPERCRQPSVERFQAAAHSGAGNSSPDSAIRI